MMKDIIEFGYKRFIHGFIESKPVAEVTIYLNNRPFKTIGIIDAALMRVNRQRADLGAYQNRMEKTVHGIAIAAQRSAERDQRVDCRLT